MGWGWDNNVRGRCSIGCESRSLPRKSTYIYVPSMSFLNAILGTVSFPSSACVVFRSFPGLSMVCFSFLSALSLAFILLLRLGHWTVCDACNPGRVLHSFEKIAESTRAMRA